MPPRAFPIDEVFGFSTACSTPEGADHADRKWCPFSNSRCEKWRQYGFGYCSVNYAAAGDDGQSYTYAVCDHRLDGAAVQQAIREHFGDVSVELVPEIVLQRPRASFDYVAYTSLDGMITDAIAIETQAIDIRGGGVGPAWRAWVDGRAGDWREYFSRDAQRRGRRDTVSYGVNMANIHKRLGLQVAEKGRFLKGIGIPLFVLMQDRPFLYLRGRVPFVEADDSRDITFMTFDYTAAHSANGQREFRHTRTVRTSLENYSAALTSGSRGSQLDRQAFLERVKRKARLSQ